MVSLNPDFRGADEVIIPSIIDKYGWGTNESFEERLLIERRGQEFLEDYQPLAMRLAEDEALLPEIVTKWNEFQKSKGRFEGSADWTLLDEFIHGKPLLWLPQIIGSCVVSNTLRGYPIRLQYQIVFLGRAQEYLGRNEFGPQNYAPYGPYSYGCARKRVNLRGGDGLFCEGIVESLLNDGVLPCSTPALVELNTRLNVNGDKDYFEPQNARVYRQWGDWQYIDSMKQYADYRVTSCPYVKSVEDLDKALDKAAPVFICSMIAVHKVGTHKDGFAIHARNPQDSWAHNMCFHGKIVASDGKKFFRFSNESWGEQHLYNVPYEEVDDWFKRRNVTAASIADIQGPSSSPPLLKAA